MARNIGPSSPVTAQKRRETFRLEIVIGGTDSSPTYTMFGHSVYVTRDAAGIEVGRSIEVVTIPLADSQITGALRAGVTNLTARFDTIALPGEP